MDGLLGGNQLGTLGLLGLNPDEINRSRNQAQSDMYFALASQLLGGGPTGASIAKGLQMGQQAYRNSLNEQTAERMQQVKLQEYLRQQQEAQAAKMRQAEVQKVVGQAFGPEVTPTTPLMNIFGQEVAGPNMPKPAGAGLTPQVVNALMKSEEGQAKLAQLADLTPKIRKAGLGVEQKAEDNPFLVFTQDETIPKNIKTLAEQYSKSWTSGRLDPDVSDKRVAELSSMAQRAQDRQTAQDNLKAQQDQMAEFRRQGLAQSAEARALQAEIAAGNLAIRQSEAAAKAEERNKPVTEAKESLNLLNQAEKLLDSATGSLTGTAVDVLAGALGKSTPGAQASSKLKAIQGALVAKMPKMSGPQSDKDVLLYREMAGQIGDSTLPVETRKSAIETIREIQERYAKVEPGSSKPAPAPTSPFKYDPAKEQRYQQWLKSQEKQ